MKRLVLSVLSLAAVAAVTATPGLSAVAAPPSPSNPAGHSSDVLGVVPAHNASKPARTAGSNLTYHNGPVMHTNKTYAIYWQPSGYTLDGTYQNVINGFFTDVAAETTKSSNVYYASTQYSDTSGAVTDGSTFGGSAVDSSPLPASGCTDSYTSVCLQDSQIRAEIDKVARANGWPRSGSLFFMFTAKGVGSCYSSSSCAFSQYCAYHSNFNSADGNTLYANMPYADTVPSACDAGQSPNTSDADATLNVTSHEHNEAITDPLGNAWYDRQGNEDGDKCAWTFGTALGGTSGAQYNQVINGHHYYLQREWSNHSSGCVLTGL